MPDTHFKLNVFLSRWKCNKPFLVVLRSIVVNPLLIVTRLPHLQHSSHTDSRPVWRSKPDLCFHIQYDMTASKALLLYGPMLAERNKDEQNQEKRGTWLWFSWLVSNKAIKNDLTKNILHVEKCFLKHLWIHKLPLPRDFLY